MTDKLKWSRPIKGEGLRGEIWPQFYMFSCGSGFKLGIRYSWNQHDMRDKYVKIKTAREGKRIAAAIMEKELRLKK